MKHKAVLLSVNFGCTLFLAVALICTVACVNSRTANQIDLQNRPQIKSSSFIGINNAWLITAKDGDLLLTKNAGQDWSTVRGDVVGGRFESIGFIDDMRGLAVNSEGQIWKSANGGENWTAVAQLLSDKPSDWQFMSSHQIRFADELRAWIVETFTIWRTDDGGNTWRQVFSVLNPGIEGQPVSVHSLDRNTAWVLTTQGRIYQTDNGGDSWQAIPLAKKVNIKDAVFANQQIGWLVAFSSVPPYSTLYSSEDAGKTWTQLSIPVSTAVIRSISFASEKEGWAAGQVWTGDAETTAAVLLHTVDGGRTWNRNQLRQFERLFYGVHFIDLQHGWLFAQTSIYRTEDSGKNWRIVLKL